MPKLIYILYFFLPLFATSQTVDFTIQSTSGLFCSPATIQFTQTSTGSPSAFIWNLGNGLTTSEPNPSTSYINPGTYTIKLTAIFAQGPLEISKTIVVNPVILPKIALDRNYICQPGTINFSAVSNGSIKSYDWDFGDLTGIVSTPANTTNHSFAGFGSYSVILKATDGFGCFGTDTTLVNVKKFPIAAATDPSSGCIPAVVSFTASDTIPSNTTVSSYAWDFGDGTNSSTTLGAASHSYGATGTFSPVLTVTTSEGCINTFNFSTVAFGIPPTGIIASAQKNTVCGSETPVFFAKAINANNYIWQFGDGDSLKVGTTSTQHKYATLGAKTVSVTPYFNGCAGNAANFSIAIVGVIAKVSFIYASCADKKTFQFLNYTIGDRTFMKWTFGDGDTSVISNPRHTFPASGQFISTFTVADDATGCHDTVSLPIVTANPTLVNADDSICINTNTGFTIADNYDNPLATYAWNVVGRNILSGTNAALTVNANILGSFDNAVIIRNGSHYCNDTIKLNHPIVVRGPNLDFTLPANSCFGGTVDIVNNSKPSVPGDLVTLWYWNYGNSPLNDTIFQPAPVQYNIPKTFSVKLTAIDNHGCQDSLVNQVTISPLPFLQVLAKADTLCLGSTDSLFAYHSDSIIWSPATRLSCITCDTVIATPATTTQYFVTATNVYGCSIPDSVLIDVIQPFTAVAPLGNQFVCLNDQVTLDMNPKNKVIVWSPANGLSNANIYNPVARLVQTSTYTATLTDSVGCFTSSANITVLLKSAPTVNAGPDRVVPYNSTFNIPAVYSSNVSTYLWSPSQSLSCTDCAAPNGIATNSEMYTIRVTSDSGCVASDSIIINIECKDANILMPKAFTPNNDNLNDFYYPITRGVKTILHFAIFNREGRILYEVNNFSPNDKSIGWDGTYKGKRQSATAYIYIMEALCELGEKLNKSGSFLLLR